MKTVEQMKALLDALDLELNSYFDWTPAALDELERWIEQTKAWVHEGYAAHDDIENDEQK